jgi:hypothetical protein
MVSSNSRYLDSASSATGALIVSMSGYVGLLSCP